MKPHFFFKGKLSREESASAFLATLLEQRPDFRSFLFSSLELAEPDGDCRVTVEDKDVDIKVDYPTDKVTVLIENKVRPGSLQQYQLVRYYESERRANADSRIVSILVGPGEGAGTNEVGRLRTHSQFRPTDSAHRVSWRLLAQFGELIQQEDRDKEFVRGGFDCIFTIIENATEEKYPLVGGREIAQEIAQNVLRALEQDYPGIRFGFWRAKDCFNIYSIGTDVTVYVDLAFRTENKEPCMTLEIPDRQHVTAILRTQFALSAKGKKNPATRQKWHHMCQDGEAEILSSGKHQLEGKWFKYETPVSGDAVVLERQLADMGRSVITSLRHLL